MSEIAQEWTANIVLGTAFLLVLRWMLYTITQRLVDVGNAIRSHALVQLDMHKTLIMIHAESNGVVPLQKDSTDVQQKAAEEYKRLVATLDATSETIKATMSQTQPLKSPILPV